MTLPPKAHYYLGCPVWACERWRGQLYTHQAPREQWLEQYSRVFNAVEGNSVFYSLPRLDTVQRWADSVTSGFRFALKFPRVITHEKRLRDAVAETRAYLELIHVLHLAGCLGTCWLQLPPGFAPHALHDLKAYLSQLPEWLRVAVEVRHPEFFRSAHAGRELDGLLRERSVDRVILDSRALFSAPPEDESEAASQSRKPRLPVDCAVTASQPLLRLIGRNQVQQNLPWVREWAARLARWIEAGLQPYVFTHTPDELHAPQLARLFHDELLRHTNVLSPLPPWPGELEGNGRQQLQLF